jgi:hypothetical protein
MTDETATDAASAMSKLDSLIEQTMNVLLQGRDHSAKGRSDAALRSYSIARQLTVQIKRQELIRAYAVAGQEREHADA